MPQEIPQNMFGFYLKHNTRPENNCYFSNYKAINGRYYSDSPQISYHNSIKESLIKEKNLNQQLIDKEEENTINIFELLDLGKTENEQANINGNGNNRTIRNSNGQTTTKKGK